MRKLRSFLTAALIGATMTLGVTAPTPQADAGFIIFMPNYFPPFSDDGTIVEIGELETFNGSGETCIVWRADSNGALYFFNGVDSFQPGDRLHVDGNLCTICLVTLTCGQPVSPILNAVVTPL